MDISTFVENTYDVFSAFKKPLAATDIDHCEECRDHNNEVNGADRRMLQPEQIGTVCWGISGFLTPEAMGYYIPRFIELAVNAVSDRDGHPYMCSFINQIGLNANSKQFNLFSVEQRSIVRNGLQILKTEYIDILIENGWGEEIDNAIAQWGT